MYLRYPTTAWYHATRELLADLERLVCAAARIQPVGILASGVVKGVITAVTNAVVVPEQEAYCEVGVETGSISHVSQSLSSRNSHVVV